MNINENLCCCINVVYLFNQISIYFRHTSNICLNRQSEGSILSVDNTSELERLQVQTSFLSPTSSQVETSYPLSTSPQIQPSLLSPSVSSNDKFSFSSASTPSYSENYNNSSTFGKYQMLFYCLLI